MDGSLTRLLDPEEVLRKQIVSFVEKGDAGLASGWMPDGAFERVWWKETIRSEEVTFDDQTFLLTRTRATQLASSAAALPSTFAADPVVVSPGAGNNLILEQPPSASAPAANKPGAEQTLRISLIGRIPPEQWNKLGTRLIPKLRTSGQDLALDLNTSLTIPLQTASYLEGEIRQALRDLGIEGLVRINKSPL